MSGEGLALMYEWSVRACLCLRIQVDCWAVARAGVDIAAAIAINTVSYVEGLLAMPHDAA